MSRNPFRKILAGDLDRRTERFDLRPITRADAEELFGQLSDPAVVAFMDIDVARDISDARQVIAWGMGARKAGVGFRWTIRDREDGTMVGTCGLHALEWERGLR